MQHVLGDISKPRQQLCLDTLYVLKQSCVSDNAKKQIHQFLFMLVNVFMLQHRRNMFYWVVLKRTSCLSYNTDDFSKWLSTFCAQTYALLSENFLPFSHQVIRFHNSLHDFLSCFPFLPVDYALLIGISP